MSEDRGLRSTPTGIREYENPYLESPVLEIGRCSVCRMEIKIDRTTGTLVEHKVAYPGERCGGSRSIGPVVSRVRRV